MARIICLVCKDCGYRSDSIKVGSTFIDETMYGPAFDTNHNELVQANYADISLSNSIIPYSDNRLRKAPSGENPEVFHWDSHEFWEKYNFCPSCNGFTLEIDPVLMIVAD
jgi:hypothetical protein